MTTLGKTLSMFPPAAGALSRREVDRVRQVVRTGNYVWAVLLGVSDVNKTRQCATLFVELPLFAAIALNDILRYRAPALDFLVDDPEACPLVIGGVQHRFPGSLDFLFRYQWMRVERGVGFLCAPYVFTNDDGTPVTLGDVRATLFAIGAEASVDNLTWERLLATDYHPSLTADD